jgi:hypothetical protein
MVAVTTNEHTIAIEVDNRYLPCAPTIDQHTIPMDIETFPKELVETVQPNSFFVRYQWWQDIGQAKENMDAAFDKMNVRNIGL